MEDLIYFKCRECGEVFTRFEDRFSIIHFLTMEPTSAPGAYQEEPTPEEWGESSS